MKLSMRNLLVVMAVVSLSTGAFAVTFMGAPTAELEKGTWKAGYSFTWAEMDVEVEGDDLEGLQMNRHYFNIGTGLAENWDFTLLLGMVKGDVDASDLGSTTDFGGSHEFSWGFNTRYTFLSDETIDWGVLAQMTWFSSEDTVDGVNVELDDVYDIQVAVGPTIDMGGWDLYGGAYYYMMDGDMTFSVPSFGFSVSGDLEEADNFGGYIGAEFEILESTKLAIECIFAGDTLGIGANIGWLF